MTIIKLVALEKGYYNDEIIEEGQKFDWKMPAWATKDGLTIEQALPPWADPVGKLPTEEPKAADKEAPMSDEQREAKIIQVVNCLDHSDDDHWTEAGLPEVAAVTELCGFRVYRSDIKALCPDAERIEE